MIVLKIIIFILLTITAGILYRVGGSSLHLANKTKYRDIGCMVCNTLTLLVIGLPSPFWGVIFFMGLTFGAYTTYHKWLNPLFGDSKDDVHWYGWFMHGFALGFASIPFYKVWYLSLLRAFLLGIAVMWWSISTEDAVKEEVGRGVLANTSLLLFLLPF